MQNNTVDNAKYQYGPLLCTKTELIWDEYVWIIQLKAQNTTVYYVLPHDIYSYAEQNEDLTITVTDCFLFSMKISILKKTSLQTVTQQMVLFM